MINDFSRSRRVAEQIRRDLAELIRLEVKDPRVALVTLTDVEVTADFAHAKVFYSALADAEQLQALATGLAHASGFLRRELGRRIKIHHLPELHFVHDASIENGARLSQLIDAAVKTAVSDEPASDAASAGPTAPGEIDAS